MNKNAICLHKFSRIFRRGILQYFPHIPCRLQHVATCQQFFSMIFASTRPVQIATHCIPLASTRRSFASTRSVQIATGQSRPCASRPPLCLHTLRADCNARRTRNAYQQGTLPPHAPCRLQHTILRRQKNYMNFASTRSVQIATTGQLTTELGNVLCLHTLRADCNTHHSKKNDNCFTFASTRSVQIATTANHQRDAGQDLCLHTLRADCNIRKIDYIIHTLTLPPHAPCRLQRQKCTELQYTLFRTRVESVDSFSVLNKSMLR